MNKAKFLEIEAKFLEIKVPEIKSKLAELGAQDRGEDRVSEAIFYDPQMTWPKENKFVRVRKTKSGVFVTYKHDSDATLDGTIELETQVGDFVGAVELFSNIGLVKFREQEKIRHTFLLGSVTADIDTWPKVPTYLELEGPSEEAIRRAAEALSLDWNKAVFGTAPRVIEDIYHIPVKSYRIYKFDRIE